MYMTGSRALRLPMQGVSISYTGNPETVINEVMTDSEGAGQS